MKPQHSYRNTSPWFPKTKWAIFVFLHYKIPWVFLYFYCNWLRWCLSRASFVGVVIEIMIKDPWIILDGMRLALQSRNFGWRYRFGFGIILKHRWFFRGFRGKRHLRILQHAYLSSVYFRIDIEGSVRWNRGSIHREGEGYFILYIFSSIWWDGCDRGFW